MTASFEILQSTMRGIYQQSARAQQAVEDMAAQSRDLENRMNEQRKADQNFYQEQNFSHGYRDLVIAWKDKSITD